MTETEKFQQLKTTVEGLNQQVSTLMGQRQEKLRQLEEILKKHGVKDLAELEVKYKKSKEEADKVIAEATAYVETTGKRLSELDATLASA